MRELGRELFVRWVAVEGGLDGVVVDIHGRPVEHSVFATRQDEANVSRARARIDRCRFGDSTAMDVPWSIHDEVDLVGDGFVAHVTALDSHPQGTDAVAKVHGLIGKKAGRDPVYWATTFCTLGVVNGFVPNSG